jgi:hypothetical protein
LLPWQQNVSDFCAPLTRLLDGAGHVLAAWRSARSAAFVKMTMLMHAIHNQLYLYNLKYKRVLV